MNRSHPRPIPAWLPTPAQLELQELHDMEDRLRAWGGSHPRLPYPIAPQDQPWSV